MSDLQIKDKDYQDLAIEIKELCRDLNNLISKGRQKGLKITIVNGVLNSINLTIIKEF